MALFGNKEDKKLEKEEKKLEKVQGVIDYYKLNELERDDLLLLSEIFKNNRYLEMISFGSFLSGNTKNFAELNTYQNELIRDQNFLIIRQLDKINKNLEKLLESRD